MVTNLKQKKYIVLIFWISNLDGRTDYGMLDYGVTKCPKCEYVASNTEEANDISSDWNNLKDKF